MADHAGALVEDRERPKRKNSGRGGISMKYRYKEVISDREAERFAWNLYKKKRGLFPTYDEALAFVFKIRTVVSNTEYRRMERAECRRLAWQLNRDEHERRAPPTVQRVAAAMGVSA